MKRQGKRSVLGRQTGTGWQLNVMSEKDKTKLNTLTGRKQEQKETLTKYLLCHRLSDKNCPRRGPLARRWPLWASTLFLNWLPCSPTYAKATKLLKIYTGKHISHSVGVKKAVSHHPTCYHSLRAVPRV